jgi:hypothetical protein
MVVGTYTGFEASKNRRRLTSLALGAGRRRCGACSTSCHVPRLCPLEPSRRVWTQGLVVLSDSIFRFDL